MVPFAKLTKPCRFYFNLAQRFNGSSYQQKNMKHWLSICTIVLLLFQNSCKKSSGSTTTPLSGKWNYTAYYFSDGGTPPAWHAVSTLNQWINIRNDGSFMSNLPPFDAATSWQLVDSIQIKFIPPPGEKALVYTYTLDTISHELQLEPVPICIEGCMQKFSK